jgi:hypothetical protein
MLSTIAEVIRDLLIFVGVIAALLPGPHFFRALYGRRMDQLEQSEKVRWRAIQGEHSIPICVNSLRPYFG